MPSTGLILRRDFDAPTLRQFSQRSSDTRQVRRLLALAAVYDGMSRLDAAKVGGDGSLDPASPSAVLRRVLR